ncbi:MAG: class I SAM-dependent methyltransferase [Acidiphilium sp.]|nr:class I SAM-dependent methyltransferase [Acidiphilium sp.]MDD4935561.1 class I SAM-dependent methyltransferase [Acidiphilium sp.]
MTDDHARSPVSSQLQTHWNAAYQRNATDKVSWYEARPTISLAMIEACALPRDARIIDIGGGASKLAANLLAAGYQTVTVLDIAQTALDAAREAAGPGASRINWICADVTQWQPHLTFDLWHDRAVFHFLVDPADRLRYIETIRRTLAPGGYLVLATFAPDGPERCSGLPVMRYAADDIAALLRPDFVLREQRVHTHQTPSGVAQRFSYARLQRTDLQNTKLN